MKITTQLKYDAPPDQVATMTADEAFQSRVCEATGAQSFEVSVEKSAQRVRITTTRSMPTDRLPDFARSLLSAGLHIREVEEWGPAAADGSRDGTIEVTIVGAPVSLSGALSLRPDGAGARGDVDAELTARVPFVGGRIEEAVAPAVVSALHVEEKTAARWLAGQR